MKKPTRILADENIALVEETFGPLGDLRVMPGREMTATEVREADVLLVRSVTRVDERLLEGSSCRFVGTATSGIDHVDTDYLYSRGITFADAAGCNADAVVDYVIAALARLSRETGQDWRQYGVGVIGCGQVGGRLARRLKAMGMLLRIHDPFLAQDHELAGYFGKLPDALSQQIVTVHTPLTTDGDHPTRHMLNADTLQWLRPGAILVNTARGAVIDSRALLARMEAGVPLRVVLDAWENEPAISRALLRRVDIGTPHIAGYSRAGKLRGTRMILDALCRHLDVEPAVEVPMPAERVLVLDGGPSHSQWQQLDRCILAAYDIASDHEALQEVLGMDGERAARHFDRMRRDYPERVEFGEFRVVGVGDKRPPASLAALGFRVA